MERMKEKQTRSKKDRSCVKEEEKKEDKLESKGIGSPVVRIVVSKTDHYIIVPAPYHEFEPCDLGCNAGLCQSHCRVHEAEKTSHAACGFVAGSEMASQGSEGALARAAANKGVAASFSVVSEAWKGTVVGMMGALVVALLVCAVSVYAKAEAPKLRLDCERITNKPVLSGADLVAQRDALDRQPWGFDVERNQAQTEAPDNDKVEQAQSSSWQEGGVRPKPLGEKGSVDPVRHGTELVADPAADVAFVMGHADEKPPFEHLGYHQCMQKEIDAFYGQSGVVLWAAPVLDRIYRKEQRTLARAIEYTLPIDATDSSYSLLEPYDSSVFVGPMEDSHGNGERMGVGMEEKVDKRRGKRKKRR